MTWLTRGSNNINTSGDMVDHEWVKFHNYIYCYYQQKDLTFLCV